MVLFPLLDKTRECAAAKQVLQIQKTVQQKHGRPIPVFSGLQFFGRKIGGESAILRISQGLYSV
jgi:hypothetical protein